MSSHQRSYYDPLEVYLFSFYRAGNRNELLGKTREDSSFTDVLVMPEVAADFDLAYLSFDGEYFTFVGLFTSGSSAATGKRRGKFEHLCELPMPVPVKLVLGWVGGVDAATVDATARISPTPIVDELASRLQEGIERFFPANLDILTDLDCTRYCLLEARSEPPEPTFFEQRDSVGLLLDIADLDRRSFLRRTGGYAPSSGNLIDALPESTVEVDEKMILEHDMEIFGKWHRQDPTFKGTRVYSNGRTKVTLLCADRSHIENVTGVDLIYHLDTYDSLVMVQYKRMSGDIYRPDRRCQRQVVRMWDTYNHMRNAPSPAKFQERDFRLSDNPFFIKICDGQALIEVSDSLIEGMYFPLEHWRHVLDAPQTRGPHEGILLSRRTAPRWFSNSEFIDIAKKGWIGSTRAGGQHWVRDLVQRSLREARSLILARLMKVGPAAQTPQPPPGTQGCLFDPR